MNRQQKEAAVSDIKEKFLSSQAAFLVEYRGLNVSLMQSLRRNLRDSGGELKVTKARLMKIAVQDITGIEDFKSNFKNQIGLVFVNQEVPVIAKKLVNFSKENDFLKIISGFFESKTISKQEIDYLASLPSKEILLAQLLGTFQAPISNFPRLLRIMIIRLLFVLKNIYSQEKSD